MGHSSLIPPVIGNWYLVAPLGSGYSGSIFRATNLHTGKVVALKVQRVDHECPTNIYERHLYPLLQGGKGMPTLWASGVQGMWDYMAIDLLGASLDNLHKNSGKDSMELGSVCSIAMQVIERLSLMHARGVLHRDIQLGNCVIGLPPHEKTIYMIDFGFSKQYIDPRTRRHIPDSKVKRDFIGNYWFSSVNVHCRGTVPSRRDDLEAAALMFIHLLTPRGLTWTRDGVPKSDLVHERLKRQKRNARPEDLCKGMPTEFEEFLQYCRRLKFKDQPDYTFWINEFRGLAVNHGYPNSDAFLWPPVAPQRSAESTHTPLRTRTPAIERDEVEGILNGLTKLNLEGRQILGNKTNVEEVTRKAQDDAKKSNPTQKEVIEISSDSDASTLMLPLFAMPKALRLANLTTKASDATNNLALSDLVHEFAEILRSNSSKTMTREASHFLDVLHKQLADPSVFVTPLRNSRQKSDRQQRVEKEPSHVKLGVVARLRREVSTAKSNKEMATMILDFGKVTNRSTGRTITKDGFAFLEGLAERLKVLG